MSDPIFEHDMKNTSTKPEQRGVASARSHRLILGVTSFCFFFLYLWPSLRMPTTFVSPDETANYFFSSLVATKTSLRSPLPFHGAFGSTVVPRSVAVVQNSYVPGSFVGLPIIVGLFAKVFGSWMILVLPILFASICAPIYYAILRRTFSPTVSLLSALLLYIHPAFWYFASRPMFHNAFFVSLLFVGGYFFLRMKESGRIAVAVFSGIVLALALWVRTSEVVWVLFSIAALCIAYSRRISRKSIISFLASLLLFGIGLLAINTFVYGSPLGSGFTTSTETITGATTTTTAHPSIMRLVLPFGVHIGGISLAVWQYFFVYMPWFAVFFLIGFGTVIRRMIKKSLQRGQMIFFCSATLVILWLFVYYGSYQFKEFADPDRLLPSSSYLRYWLPAYVLTLPFCATGLRVMYHRFSRKRVAWVFSALVLLTIVVFSARDVMFDPLLGLVQVRTTEFSYANTRNIVQRATEKDAVIIAGNSDKVFFPQRSVLVQLSQDPVLRLVMLERIVSFTPIYFYRNVAESVSQKNWMLLGTVGWNSSPIARDGDNILYSIHAPGEKPAIETNPLTE